MSTCVFFLTKVLILLVIQVKPICCKAVGLKSIFFTYVVSLSFGKDAILHRSLLTWSCKFEFRAVREMSETLKRNRHPEEQVASSYSCSASEQEDCSDLRGSVGTFSSVLP